MQREDLRSSGEVGWQPGSLDVHVRRSRIRRRPIAQGPKGTRRAKADVRAERKRIQAKIARLWTSEEIAAAKAAQ